MNKIIYVLAAAVFSFAVYKFNELCTPPALPILKLDTYWGPGSPVPDDKSIRQFKIVFKDEVIEDLKDRLANHRPFQAPLEGIGFEYGFNTNYLDDVVTFWKDQYDFRAREEFLNQYPQFLTKVQGLDIHFLHVKPTKSNPQIKILPLLLLHGWPGSVREFYEILPLLTTPQPGKDFVFEVIAPSLPGFGFSQAASKSGLGAVEVSVVLRNLMLKLGFNKFVIQGGDWGSIIGSNLATLFPGEVIGYHTNMPFVQTPLSGIKTILGSFFPSLVVNEEHIDRIYPLSKKWSFLLEETGYFHIQASKPDTVGVSLNDSPAGLAAYILEKFTTWTNFENKFVQSGNLTKKFKLVDLIDNLMFYWVSGSITTSMRLYAETFNKRTQGLGLDRIPTEVPTAAIYFKYEFALQPKEFLKEKYPNLLQYTVVDHTGHFAALENPKALAYDLFDATVHFLKFTPAK